MSNRDRSCVIHLADARSRISGPAGERSVSVLRRGSLNLKLSLPVASNRQIPHEQDEIYVIMKGKVVLFHDGKRDAFEPGGIMFIAAGTEHHFEDFSEDLTVWVIFYGPKVERFDHTVSDERSRRE